MSELRRIRPLLGTYIEIGVPNGPDAVSATDAAFLAIETIHDLMSFHSPQSDISRLNMMRQLWLPISNHTYRVLRLAKALYCASGHLFNVTVGGALVTKKILPDHGFDAYDEMGDPLHIGLTPVRAINNSGGLICVDGIAKGYAVDRAIDTLKACDLPYGWVNAGGDIRVFGDRVLPIEQKKANQDMRSLGGLKDMAIATSEVFKTPNSNFKAWIVGADTLGEAGVFSVVSHSAWRADALTKVAALAVKAQRAELIAKLGGFLIEA